jgi:small GTP-binding protein
MYHVCLIGDSAVGKTSLSNAMLNQPFDASCRSTPGALMAQLQIATPEFTGTIALWDTAGTEQYRALAPIYYRDSCAAIFVFDVTRINSFTNLSYWADLYGCDEREGNPILLLAYKIDRTDRTVEQEAGSEFARGKGWKYLETSAADGTNVENIAEELGKLLKNHPPSALTFGRFQPRVKSVICC